MYNPKHPDDLPRAIKKKILGVNTGKISKANIPFGGNGFYGLAGYHLVTVSTAETLNESSYGNEDIQGYQLGIGQRSGNFKYEFAYSDFEDINISSTGGGTNSISANADALTFRMSYGF